MSEIKIKQQRQIRRLNRTRKHVLRKSDRPRLTVSRSNMHFYAQIIDDKNGKTVISAQEKEIGSNTKITKTQKAEELGKILAQKAKTAKVTKVVFDKGAYRYHGRVKAFATGAREGGLEF